MVDRYKELFSRNMGILTKKDQKVLKDSCIAIAGVGGVGGIQLATLARSGVGSFDIADPDIFNLSDRNRQYGATESSLGKNKAEEMATIVKDINPYCNVRVFQNGVNNRNVNNFVKNADVVIDSIEYFTIDQKVNLYKKARDFNKFVFTSPIIGFGSSLLVFDPNGITFEEYFNINEDNKKLNFSKLCPIYPDYVKKSVYTDSLKKKRPIPSFSGSTAISAALITTDIILFLTHKKQPIIAPKCKIVDFYRGDYIIINIDNMKWEEFWNEFSETYNSMNNLPEYKNMIDKVVESAGKRKNILDIGCGTGDLALELSRHNKVTGIDYSQKMLKLASKKIKGKQNINLIKGEATSLKFKDKTFDFASLVNILFNMDNPKKVIREVNRILKRNGKIVIVNPKEKINIKKKFRDKVIRDFKKINISSYKIDKLLKYNKIIFSEGGIKFNPDINELRRILENFGFEIIKQSSVYYETSYYIEALKK